MRKPDTCQGCALFTRGYSYAPAIGPRNAKIVLVGEALGTQEALVGQPFVGQAGGMLDRILRLCGFSRAEFRIDNIVRCKPPNNQLADAPYELEAIEHCSQYISSTLSENHLVVMPLGGIASRRILGLAKGVGKMQDLHGTISRDPTDRYWVIPTFHPSYLQRGAHKLTGVAVHDFQLAAEIAVKGHPPDPGKLIVDPSVAWFGDWVDRALKSASTAPFPPWMAVDIETPEKARGVDEGELQSGKSRVAGLEARVKPLGEVVKSLNLKDPTNIILRVNFSYNEDEGVTVPFTGAYKDLIRILLDSPLFAFVFWNIDYDRPRLEANDCPVAEPAHDFMWAWHMLQSDIPRGLGFVAPFYSRYGPWKHLSDEKPGEYAAIDGIQTIRCAKGIERDLRNLGMWEWYERHIYNLDHLALKPAEKVGLLMEPEKLGEFKKMLFEKKTEIIAEVRSFIPEELRPIEKEYKTDRTIRDSETNELMSGIEEKVEISPVYVCSACETIDVPKGHSKTKKCAGAKLRLEDHEVRRWIKWGQFNPVSPTQMLRYIRWRGHQPGKSKKSSNPSADAAALEKLAKRHSTDPVYKLVLELRKVDKMHGTYAEGMLKRMDENGRVHTTFTHKPSTLRLSSGDPNLQNLVKRGDDEETQYAKKFRECVVAEPGCRLIEADYAGIEAVQTGFFSADPNYIRLAKMGVHSYLCSHILKKPADLSWEDEKLAEYLAQIKHDPDPKVKAMYARAKRCVHGTNYGMTPKGMHLNYPETFKTVKEAKEVHEIYMAVCPKLHQWHREIVQRAHKQGYLGGKDHPFRYRHWFWNVINYRRITIAQFKRWKDDPDRQVIHNDSGFYAVEYGEDTKRAVAFYPQSTTGGIIKEAMLGLFDPELEDTYIGDVFYGKTPFRMPIHDSIVLEVPENQVDFVLERVVKVMTAPVKQQPCPESWGIEQTDGLRIGVEVEVGKNWAQMEEINISDYGTI